METRDSSKSGTIGGTGDHLPALNDALDLVADRLSVLSTRSPAGDLRYSSVPFFEPTRDEGHYRGAIVLCPGLAADAIADLAERLQEASACAMVVSNPGEPLDAAVAARDLPILVSLSGDWAELAGLLRALLATAPDGRVSDVRLGDLFGLANTVAELAGNAVSLVDATGQVVGYSTHPDQPIDDMRRHTSLLLQEETPPSLDPDYRAVMSSAHLLSFASTPGQFGRVAVAVRASGELLGTVWVVHPGTGSTMALEHLLVRIGPIVAEHLLRARATASDDDLRTSDLVRTLVEHADKSRSAAAQLLVRPDVGCGAVCFRLNTPDGAAALRGLHRLRLLVRSLALTASLEVHCAIIGPHVVALVAGGAAERVTRFAAEVVRTDPALVAGVGRLVRAAAEIPRSYREAVETATFLLDAPGSGSSPVSTRVSAFAMVRDRLALRQVGEVLRTFDAAVDDAACRLIAHDRRHGSELAQTILAYLDHRGNVRETANALRVHQNTVRYRLDTARSELDIDLDSASTRLWLWLRLATATDGL